MALEEMTGVRDLTFSAWHRSLADDNTWIDIDCCHYCKYCNSLLGLFELVRSPDELSLVESCRRKKVAITERVGIGLGIPVFKIAYTGTPMHSAAIMKAGQPSVDVLQPTELGSFIHALHDCEFCRRHRGGRFRRK